MHGVCYNDEVDNPTVEPVIRRRTLSRRITIHEGDYPIKIVPTTYPASDKSSGFLQIAILSVEYGIRGHEISQTRA